jgi:hypothetical protein
MNGRSETCRDTGGNEQRAAWSATSAVAARFISYGCAGADDGDDPRSRSDSLPYDSR